MGSSDRLFNRQRTVHQILGGGLGMFIELGFLFFFFSFFNRIVLLIMEIFVVLITKRNLFIYYKVHALLPYIVIHLFEVRDNPPCYRVNLSTHYSYYIYTDGQDICK